ncbi:DUF4166 domain-containing protein [Rhodobacteraceae bacterium NNCM2]|nr:DUF4166 domain-containing protein [Coraliihabitans acroporae]
MTGAPFRVAMAERWGTLPPVLQDFHDGASPRRFRGRAEITRGPSRLAGLIATFFGFPEAAEDVPVVITVTSDGKGERWERMFAESRMTSRVTRGAPGAVRERMGPCTFQLDIRQIPLGITLTVGRGWVLGIPIPARLLPISDATEVEHDGAFCFDIHLALPILGKMVQYRGWLKPEESNR